MDEVRVVGRSQTRHWIRDKQIGACTALIEESTRMQRALLRQQRGGRKADWTAWNQALAMIWLVGVPDVIDAAATMERVFWSDGTRIKAGQITDDEWAAARDRMESARLSFINAARRNIVRVPDARDPPARSASSAL
jgi:hypothetical protein